MKADTITKDYVRNTDIFADIFNFYIYGGEQVIHPEQLTEKDPTKTALPYGRDGTLVSIQKLRDLQKLCAVMTDEEAEYVLFGAELQSETHYAMPVRNNLYDAIDYIGQVENAARTHRMERRKTSASSDPDESRYTPNRGEFLSGFWKSDRLIPSVTLTIHFGADPWDSPMSLFEMMGTSNPRILACMDNYHLRLISPALMSDEEIMKFQSSLREVMLFIKYSKDREALKNILAANESRYKHLERRAAEVVTEITNLKLEFDEEKEYVDMCQAVKEMCDESRAEGITLGRAEGRAEGKAQKAQEIAKKLYTMAIPVEGIAQAVDETVETVKQWLGLS